MPQAPVEPLLAAKLLAVSRRCLKTAEPMPDLAELQQVLDPFAVPVARLAVAPVPIGQAPLAAIERALEAPIGNRKECPEP